MSQPPPDQDQQLLQDALTLLMFANAAAGNPSLPQQPSPPQVAQPPPLNPATKPPVLPHTGRAQPLQTLPQMPSQPPLRPVGAIQQPKYNYPGYYNWQGTLSPPQTHAAQPAFAPPQPSHMATSHSPKATQRPSQPSYPREIIAQRHLLDPQPAAAPPVAPRPPQAPPRKVNIFSLLDGSEKPPAPVKTESDPGLKPTAMAPLPPLPAAQPVATAPAAPRAPLVPHKSLINMFLNEDTPAVSIKQKLVLPPQSHEPIVPPTNRHLRLKLSPANPGPPPLLATQAMLGIDLKLKERSNKNAMIAARALAAAAEVPLTPQQREVERQAYDATKVKVEPHMPRSIDVAVDQKPPVATTAPAVAAPPRQSPSPKSQQPKPRSKLATPKPLPVPSQPAQSAGPQHPAGRAEATVIPPLETYRVDPDLGLIGCICGLEDDDGFTIQCDQCFRWQHCLCMGYKTQEEVPENEYKCYYCDPAKHGKFDPSSCREATLRRLNVELTKQPLPKKRKPLSGDSSANKKRKLVPTEPVKPAPRPPLPVLILDQLPIKDNPLLTDGVTTETYQLVYFKVKQNDFKTPELRRSLTSLLTTKAVEHLEDEDGKFKHLKFAKVVLPNHQKYMAEHLRNILTKKKRHNQFSIQVKPYVENTKLKFNGISKMGLFIGSSDSDINVVPKGTLVVEYLGEIDLFENYVSEKINQYPHWGVPKPHVLKLKLGDSEIVVDARFVGNELRFIRKLCPHAANCRVRPVYDAEAGLRFLVETTKDIEIKDDLMTELKLPWEWDPTHPILSLYGPNPAELKFDLAVPLADKPALMLYIDNILFFCECACMTGPDAVSSCAVLKVKKAMAQVMRSTRKALSIANVNLVKTKEEVIFPQLHKQYVLWAERLVQRDNIIRLQVEVKLEDTMAEGVLVEKPQAKPKELFDVPYREQLIERHQPAVPPAKSNPVDADMAFPIVPELAQRIDKIIDERLKPIQATSSGQNDDTTKKELISASSPILASNVVKEEAVKKEAKPELAPQPPKPVKKLSFADYKKKMK